MASRRYSDNWLRNFLAARLWRCFHMWGNLETNPQLILALRHVPRLLRWGLLGGLLVLKAVVFLFCGLSGWLVFRRIRYGPAGFAEYLTVALFGLVLWRTLTLGVLFCQIEHRYMLVAWPACLWCAAYSLFILGLKWLPPTQPARKG
jgi:hypothetical protein